MRSYINKAACWAICDNYSIVGHSLEMCWSQLFLLGGFFLAVLSVGTRPYPRTRQQLVYHPYHPETPYPVHLYWQLLDHYYDVMGGNRLMESPIFDHQDHHLQGIIDVWLLLALLDTWNELVHLKFQLMPDRIIGIGRRLSDRVILIELSVLTLEEFRTEIIKKNWCTPKVRTF